MEKSTATFELVRTALLALHPHAGKIELSTSSKIADLDIDSVGTLELVGRLERDVGVELPDDELVHLQTLGDVVTLIDRYSVSA